MSIKDQRLLQKIKEYNQAVQGANTGQQSYTGVNQNLLQRATNDPDKNDYLIYADDNPDPSKDITQRDLRKFDHKELLKTSLEPKLLRKTLNAMEQSGDYFTPEEINEINDIHNSLMKYDKKNKALAEWYKKWATNYNDSILEHTIGKISDIGSYSKDRLDGESKAEYIARMKQLALNQPTSTQVIENRKLKDKNILRNNLLKIADIKQVELIMNDKRLDNPDIIHKINSIWNKLIAEIRDQYIQIDAKVFVDFALSNMYKVETKKEGKFDRREVDLKDIKMVSGMKFVVDKNMVVDYDTGEVINKELFETDDRFKDIKTRYGNITTFKAFLKSGNAPIGQDSIKPKDEPEPEPVKTKRTKKSIPEPEPVDPKPVKAKDTKDPKKVKAKDTEGKGLVGGFKLLSSKTKPLMRGRGLQPIASTKGIKQTEENDFVDFGKYVINTDKLESNRLRVLYRKTFLNIKEIPTKTISDDLKDLLLELIEMQRFNERIYSQLDEKEKTLCRLLLEKSNVKKILKLKLGGTESEFISKRQRFEVLIGEINAGNDSPLIKDEAKQILRWLKSNNHITTQVYNKTMEELD